MTHARNRRSRRAVAALALCLAGMSSAAQAAVILSGGGLVLAEEGGAFDFGNLAGVGNGGTAFTSSDLGPELGIPFHVAANINDQTYGNGNSWIGGTANPFPAPFAGVNLGGSFTIESFAFGRDNTGAFADRALGLYTLQFTTDAAPSASTPDSSWLNIGTLNYQGPGGANFAQPARRHRYNFTPVTATGLRLLVPGTGIANGTAIDEIEIYENPGVVVPPPPNLVLTPSAGFGIGFNGNNGPYIPENPAPVPDNRALASNGAVAIGSSSLGPQIGVPFHVVANVNDGLYGNANSWIGGDGDTAPFIGVTFPAPVAMERIAFSRDNGNDAGDCCGGRLTDRAMGLYTLQFTRVANPDGTTTDTGDPATGWATLSTINYQNSEPGIFDPALRHEFSISENGTPVIASGFRILPPGAGLGPQGTAIDEIEVYGVVVPEPGTLSILCLMGSAAVLRRRR